MKINLILLALLSFSFGFSQNLSPIAVSKMMSKGMQPGLEVFIPDVSEDNLEDAIKEITKPYKGKTRKIKRTDETFIDDVSIEKISANTIDIHQTIEKGDKGYTYTAYFNLGGIFLDSTYSSEKFAYAADIVTRIALKASEERINEMLKDENKALDKLEDAKKDLSKDNERAARDIQKAKDLVAEKERDIKDNLKMIETKSSEIESQRQKVNELQNQRAVFLK